MGGVRILVVDDNVHAAESLVMVAKIWGHEARAIYDGSRVLDVVKSDRPDVVLLDIHLPGMDGHEIAQYLRQRPEFDGLVLIALTGLSGVEALERSKQAGFDFHLVKPIDFAALESILALISRA